MTSPHFPSGDSRDLFEEAIERLITDEPLELFSDWFSSQLSDQHGGQQAPTPEIGGELMLRHRAMARALWAAVPVPSNRWHPRTLPKTDRNDPCHCGSGRKFKQCCAQFGLAELPLDSANLLAVALAHATPDMLDAARVRLVPGEALGMAAMAWNERGHAAQTVQVLQPLFTTRDDLDFRFEMAFDALLDALLDLHQETTRYQLAERVGQFKDKKLATAARCRQVTMLCDRGEAQAAWNLFQATLRFNPNDPQLWHLELTLLLSEGRTDEAKMRGTALAAQARRLGHGDFAQTLQELGNRGFSALLDDDASKLPPDADELEWIALCGHTPATLDVQACRALYQITSIAAADSTGVPTLEIRPKKALSDLYRRWSRNFEVVKPIMTQLQGDVDLLLDSLASAHEFLRLNPQAWLCMDLLDDLLLAAAEFSAQDAPGHVLRASRRLADHALTVLRALAGDTPVHILWSDTPSRPLLRTIAQAVDLALDMRDPSQAQTLMRWAMALNPNDNHGWRGVLVPLYLRESKYGDALKLLEEFPEDIPPAEHLRALALFAKGDTALAEVVLRAAHAVYPLYLDWLLPDEVATPKATEGPGIQVGGVESAWHHRLENRPVWLRTGALVWAKGLDLPAPKPAKAAKRPKNTALKSLRKPAKSSVPADISSFAQAQERHLRKYYADYPRLHGFLMAVGWSPDMIMPTQWIPVALALRNQQLEELPESKMLSQMNKDLDAISRLTNHFNDLVLSTPSANPAPLASLQALLAGDDAQAVYSWTAGFMQGSEMVAAGWRKAGRPVANGKRGFGELYALAAQAQPAGNGDPDAADGRPEPWRARQSGGYPLLVGLDNGPLGAKETLLLVLEDLWHVVAPLRQARAEGIG